MSQTSPDTGTASNTYDSGGNLATSTDARGAVSSYTYDALNRISTVAYKVGRTTDQSLTFTYDAGTNGKGRLTGASDANHSLSWAYDTHGRVTGKGQTIGSLTKSVGYGYTNGDLTSMITPSGQTISYTYTNGQVSQISVNGTILLTNVVYEPFGPVRSWSWGNGSALSRLHDTDGNVSQISSAEQTNYGYDSAFRITSLTNSTVPSASANYDYDALDRLTSAMTASATSGWTYDANGNRLTQTGATAVSFATASSSNRLTSTSGGLVRSYTYDAAGNTLTYAGTTFTYFNSGRMKTAKVGSSTTTFVYNAQGQRIEKSGGVSGTVLNMYDEAGHLIGEYTGTGGLTQETIYLGDIPVATLRPSGSTIAIYYVHSDNLNTPRAITRPSDNAFAWQWHGDAFGNGTPAQNPQGLGTFAYNLRFPGQYYDSESGLHYNYFRDYDPQTSRYIEPDPLLGLTRWVSDDAVLLVPALVRWPKWLAPYVYVTNNPLSEQDSFGMGPLSIIKCLWYGR
jgi:RHS repeat-associated protein